MMKKSHYASTKFSFQPKSHRLFFVTQLVGVFREIKKKHERRELYKKLGTESVCQFALAFSACHKLITTERNTLLLWGWVQKAQLILAVAPVASRLSDKVASINPESFRQKDRRISTYQRNATAINDS